MRNDPRVVQSIRIIQDEWDLNDLVGIVYRPDPAPKYLLLGLADENPREKDNKYYASIQNEETAKILLQFIRANNAVAIIPKALRLWHWLLPTAYPHRYPFSQFLKDIVEKRAVSERNVYLDKYYKTAISLTRYLIQKYGDWQENGAHLAAAIMELAIPWLIRELKKQGVVPLAIVLSDVKDKEIDRLFVNFPPEVPIILKNWCFKCIIADAGPANLPGIEYYEWDEAEALLKNAYIVFGLREIKILFKQQLATNCMWFNLRPAFEDAGCLDQLLIALTYMGDIASVGAANSNNLLSELFVETHMRATGSPASNLIAVSYSEKNNQIISYYQTLHSKQESQHLRVVKSINDLPQKNQQGLKWLSLPGFSQDSSGQLGNVLWQEKDREALAQSFSTWSRFCENEYQHADLKTKHVFADLAMRGCILANLNTVGTSTCRSYYRNLQKIISKNVNKAATQQNALIIYNRIWQDWYIFPSPADRSLIERARSIRTLSSEYLQNFDKQQFLGDVNGWSELDRVEMRKIELVMGAILAIFQKRSTVVIFDQFQVLLPDEYFKVIDKELSHEVDQLGEDKLELIDFPYTFEAKLQSLFGPTIYDNYIAEIATLQEPIETFSPMFRKEFLGLLLLLNLRATVQEWGVDQQVLALQNLQSMLSWRYWEGLPHERAVLEELRNFIAEDIKFRIRNINTEPQIQLDFIQKDDESKFLFGHQAEIIVKISNQGLITAKSVVINIVINDSFTLTSSWFEQNSRDDTREIGTLADREDETARFFIIPRQQKVDLTIQCRWQQSEEAIQPALLELTRTIYVQVPTEQETKPINTFFSGYDGEPIIDPGEFIGKARKERLIEVMKALTRKAVNFMLWAPKRYGKTTFMQMIRKIILNIDNARELFQVATSEFEGLDAYLPVFFSLADLSPNSVTLNSFYLFLLRGIRQAIQEFKREPYEEIVLYYESLKEKYPDSPGIDTTSVTHEIDTLLKDSDIGPSRFIILLDEFDLAYDLIQADHFDLTLRSLLEKTTQTVSWIFSTTYNLVERRQEPGSVLFGLTGNLLLDPWDEHDVALLIQNSYRAGSSQIEFTGGAENTLYRYTGGHPYYTQLLCYQVVKLLNEKRSQLVDMRLLEEAGRDLMQTSVTSASDTNKKFGWNQASPVGKLVLIAIGQNWLRSISEQDLFDEVQKMISNPRIREDTKWLKPRFDYSIHKFLSKTLGMIAEIKRGKKNYYKFSIPIFGHWLHQPESQPDLLAEAQELIEQQFNNDQEFYKLHQKDWEQESDHPVRQLTLLKIAYSHPLEPRDLIKIVQEDNEKKFGGFVSANWLIAQIENALDYLVKQGILQKHETEYLIFRQRRYRAWLIEQYKEKSDIEQELWDKLYSLTLSF